MKIIFFGSDNFAILPLKALMGAGYDILCVVTQPDKSKGRGLALAATPVKALALEHKLKIYQPASINNKEALGFLKGLGADLFVIIAYGQILAQEILDIPRLLPVNLHASFLPKYRGAAPINWALINGEKQTGVSIIKVIKKMDAGPVIAQKSCAIEENDNAVTLAVKLSQVGSGLLLETIKAVEQNKYHLTSQEEELATLAPKLKKQDGLIDWNKPALEIHNLIRGCLDWPGAVTYYKGKLLKIYRARPDSLAQQSLNPAPGELIKAAPDGITVATGKGSLIIEELQIEGKRVMKAGEFLSGHKVCAGELLTKK